jgi:diguanylate cyclase (GGDEF)-like protein
MILSREPLGRQFLISILVVSVLCAIVLALFAGSAVSRIDAQSSERESTLVEEAVRRAKSDLVESQKAIVFFDEGVRVSGATQTGWVASEPGAGMQPSFRNDVAFVVSPDGMQIPPMGQASRTDVAAYGDLPPEVADMVDDVQMRISLGEQPAKAAAVDVATVDGRPTIVSVAPFVPAGRKAEADFLHVTYRPMDAILLDRMSQDYRLGAISLALPDERIALELSSVELSSRDGAVLGRLSWKADAPGTRMVLDTLPGFAAAVLGVAALVVLLVHRCVRSAAELEEGRSRAHHVASHDPLTGIPNRLFFNASLDRAVELQRSKGLPFSVLCLDLDRFKQVNDLLGHPSGDELIRQAGARIAAAAGPGDVVARLGGDEFAAILCSAVDPERFSDDLVAALGAPYDLFGTTANVGASIGFVRVEEPDGDRSELLRRADVALYEAKKRGRNRSHRFDETIDEGVRDKRRLEKELVLAVATGEGLRLVYQPMFARDGVTMVGAEALLRWDHPSLGTLQPSRFLGLADERGLAGALGRRVMDEACRTAAQSDIPWIAVNVSAVQLRSSGFAEEVLETLRRHSILPSRLQIEISESLLLDPSDETVAEIARLRTAGVRIAIDDFGTAGSSIRYLTRYSLDKIKIDRSFVHAIAPGAGSSSEVVKAIIGLAKAVGVEVGIEGIETLDQLDAFAELDCGEMQGFLFADPVDGSDLGIRTASPLHRMSERMMSERMMSVSDTMLLGPEAKAAS